MPDPISPDLTARAIRQLREDVLNARECEDDTIEVLTDAVETLLAEVDRLKENLGIAVEHMGNLTRSADPTAAGGPA